MYRLQTTVTVKDKEFHITNDGDFRMVLDCFRALTDEEMSEDLRVLASLLIFYNELTCYMDMGMYEEYLPDMVKEMYKFFNCGQEESPGVSTNHSLVDWDQDETIICAAINKVANTEIRSVEYLHWWTFMGYYMSIGESVLSTVVSIRDKITKHKKLEKWEQDFKRSNPGYFHWKANFVGQSESEKLLKELWNKEGG